MDFTQFSAYRVGNVVASRQEQTMGSGVLGMHVRNLCVKHTCVFVEQEHMYVCAK